MAVFGQIPRVPGGLLQDDRSLCYKPEQTDNFTRPEILRAEAVKALAEINASAALRRALLRKTATTIRRDLLPGQPCAFWRWQNPRGRATRKRGGWTMARFLSYDPDLKSAWVHSGTTTMQVAVKQVRAACGFESWTPDKADIDLLHDAARNIREDMWEDHRAAGHDPEEDSYDFEFPTELALPLAALPTEPQPHDLPAPAEEAPAQQLPPQVSQQSQHVQQEQVIINSPTYSTHYHPQRFGPTRQQLQLHPHTHSRQIEDIITGTTCSTITATVPSHTTSDSTSTIHGDTSSSFNRRATQTSSAATRRPAPNITTGGIYTPLTSRTINYWAGHSSPFRPNKPSTIHTT